LIPSPYAHQSLNSDRLRIEAQGLLSISVGWADISSPPPAWMVAVQPVWVAGVAQRARPALDEMLEVAAPDAAMAAAREP
jgi:hypothetical protein